MSDDDDNLMVLEKSPNLPTLRQIDKVVQKVVTEAKENGIPVKNVKLYECLKVS